MTLLAITGPTASGKSELACRLAPLFDAEIISVDSMQVYRGMDIGTAKPPEEVRERIPHHLIDVADPDEEFSVGRFQRLGRNALEKIRGAGKIAILVGGSGLYYSALAQGFGFAGTDPAVRRQLEERLGSEGLRVLADELTRADPESIGRVDLSNPRRVVRALEILAIRGRPEGSDPGEDVAVPAVRGVVLSPPRALLEERIRTRAEAMLRAGLADEVRSIGRFSKTSSQAVGYREVARALQAGEPPELALGEIVSRSLQLARRQRSWFKRDPRLVWVSSSDDEAAFDFVRAYFERVLAEEAGKEERGRDFFGVAVS